MAKSQIGSIAAADSEICVIFAIESTAQHRNVRDAMCAGVKLVWPPRNGNARQPAFSTISTGAPVSGRMADQAVNKGECGERELSFSTAMDFGGLFVLTESGSVAFSAAGATANLVFPGCLGRHRRILKRRGRPRVSTYPTSARFRFGDGRVGDVRHSADIAGGFAGNEGESAAFALEADMPA